jgi:hypothetical protein
MRRLLVLTALLFAFPAHAVEMEWVMVLGTGTPNACDPIEYQGCFGAVGHSYLIAKYEVTNAQYTEFLNAVAAWDADELYDDFMGSSDWGGITRSGSNGSYSYSVKPGWGDKPVNYVSLYDGLCFANWLHNGQPTGGRDDTTTEDGAYTIEPPWDTVIRNPGARFFIPSEDEWYKAAYYHAASASYFDYPVGTDTQTVCAAPGPTANTANCDHAAGNTLTDVGSYKGSPGPYGTFDQGGNLFEWNETVIDYYTELRGGSFNARVDFLSVEYSYQNNPFDTYGLSYGFRVASYPACDDGHDNDGDGLIDHPDDPGCMSPLSNLEDPACQDGDDNDGDGMIDFDGGLSALGYLAASPDPGCDLAWQVNEDPIHWPCGLGSELTFILPPFFWLWLRRRRSL